ncbi:hypothetical protein [Sphingobium sp. YR768]|uniref:hypothetical protein n=1 Tax=Sphingobium sp. YR768 TaxID=1884365 RepID=UPI0008BC04D9|nr:hypothetical protein [Sphingobium sp. YR768]SES10725.1 hypothetical protein SAMN05518866_13931 [Sphingobium sp. YR768]
MNAIADGGDEFVEIRAILSKARNDRDAIAQQLADLEACPVITLHPGIANDYRAQIEVLTEALSSNDHAVQEAIPKLRALIGGVTVYPPEGRRGVEVEATGRSRICWRCPPARTCTRRCILTLERVAGIEPASQAWTVYEVADFRQFPTTRYGTLADHIESNQKPFRTVTAAVTCPSSSAHERAVGNILHC